MCLTWFYASGYCPFPCPPSRDYFKAHVPCSGDNCVALCTLCGAGSSHDCLCSGPQTWVCGNTGLQWKYCLRHHGRGAGAGGGLGPGRSSFPMMLKPVLSPHQTCLVFELSEAFGTGISHPCWAEDSVCVCACTGSETRSVPRENPCA